MANKRGRTIGYKMNDEVKKKISETLKGRTISNQHRQRIRKGMKDYYKSTLRERLEKKLMKIKKELNKLEDDE